jgi:kinesin family protein 5
MAENAIRVIVRFRPMNDRERGDAAAFNVDAQRGSVQALASGNDGSGVADTSGAAFTFDGVHDWNASQSELYDSCARATIDDVLRGFNGTIFAYGQTGAGKSFTMFGDPRVDALSGIVPRACAHLFACIASDACGATEFTIRCSFLEVYCEAVCDLLNPSGTNLRVRESPERGVWVDGLSQVFCTCADDVLQLLQLGEKARSVASTNMNAVSSRSHSLFVLELTQKLADGSTKSARLNLVDLAGSEKIAKTGATGETLEEAKKINQSLSALGNCIVALTESRAHVPYRDSKLTFILRESLGGNCKTTLLVAASPARSNVAETLSSLRFGARAKLIKNTVTVNVRRSAAQLEELLAFEEWFARRLAAELDGDAAAADAFLERRRLARAAFAAGAGSGGTPALISASSSSPASPSAAAAAPGGAHAEALDAAQFQIQQLESELSELRKEQRAAAAPASQAAELTQVRAELALQVARGEELQKQVALAERKLLAADDACEAMSLELATQRLVAQSEIRRAQVAETRSQQAVADAERAVASTAALESRIVDDQMRIDELMTMVLDLEQDAAAAKAARAAAESAAAESAALVLRLQASAPPDASAERPASQLQVDLESSRSESQSLRAQIEILQRLLEERASATAAAAAPAVAAPPSDAYDAERATATAQIKQLTRTTMTQESRIKQLESALLNEQQMRAVEQAQLSELEQQCLNLQTASKEKDQVARQLASELASTRRDLADANMRADSFLGRLETQTNRLVEVEQQLHQAQVSGSVLTNSRIAVPVGGRRVWGDAATAAPAAAPETPTASPIRPSPKAVRAAAASGADLLVPHEADLSHPERAGFLRLRLSGLLWKKWRDAYVVLAGKRLVWFFDKTSGEPSGSVALAGLALLRDAEQMCGTAHSFALLDADRGDELVFAAGSDGERLEWAKQIQSCGTRHS